MTDIELTCPEHGCIHTHSGVLLDTCVLPWCTCALNSAVHTYYFRLRVPDDGILDPTPRRCGPRACTHCYGVLQ